MWQLSEYSLDIGIGLLICLTLGGLGWRLLQHKGNKAKRAPKGLEARPTTLPRQQEPTQSAREPIVETDGEQLVKDATTDREHPAGSDVAQPAPTTEQLDDVAPKPTQVIELEQADAIWQQGLSRSRASLWGRLQQLWQGKPTLDGALLEQLEAVLLTADVGVKLTNQFLRQLQERQDTPMDAQQLRQCLQEMMQESLQQVIHLPVANGDGTHIVPPKVVLLVGVNGAGKTTTIGKLAKRWHKPEQPVVLAAADTFRAAAAEQLGVWAERTGCRLIQGPAQSDPSSVVFQAITAAKADGAALVLVDTAGRLHTDQALMEEVAKIKRVAGKAHPGAPHEIWLVIDGTAGQNGLQQAKQFHEKLTLTGLILTKVDGSAKGGIVLAIADALRLPVRYVGFGEGADDLQAFSREQFVRALLADTPAA